MGKNYYLFTLALNWRYLCKYPWYFVGMGIRAVYFVGENITPILFGLLLNQFQSGKTTWQSLWLYVLAYGLLKVLNPFLEIFTGHLNWTRASKVMLDYQYEMLQILQHARPNYWKHKSRGAVQSAIVTASGGLRSFAALISHSYLGAMINIIAIIVASFVINPYVLLILIIHLALFILNLQINTVKEKDLGLIENIESEKLQGFITEFFHTFITTLYLHLFNRQYTRIRNQQDEVYKAYRSREQVSIFGKWLINHVLSGLTQAAILLLLVNDLIAGRIQIGTLSIVIVYAQTILGQLGNIVEYITQYVKFVVDIERVDTLVTTPLLKEKPNPNVGRSQKMVPFRSLYAKNLCVKHDGESESLREFSLSIQHGEAIAIVGYSGSGKSTFLDVFLKVIEDYTGTLQINGLEHKTLDFEDIHEITSIVPQQVQLFQTTLQDNICLESNATKIEFEKAVRATSLDEVISKHGLKYIINEANTNISGGECQRVGIARTLLMNRDILILDEATASLDPKTERDVVNNIVNLYPEKTLIYVTHKYSLLDIFDKILVMSDGKIVESGGFAELKSKAGLFSDLYKASQSE
jgi:ABC-type bacteriocin/lantibiotic exporter with double-glycine peptidase domain